jgi:hypothetical protein
MHARAHTHTHTNTYTHDHTHTHTHKWQPLSFLPTDAVKVGAFWRDYKAELLEHFPPLNYTLLQQHVTDFRAVQSVGADLTSIDALPDGSIYAVVKDWKSFELFMSEYEAFTNADLFTHNTKVKGGMANKLYYCR